LHIFIKMEGINYCVDHVEKDINRLDNKSGEFKSLALQLYFDLKRNELDKGENPKKFSESDAKISNITMNFNLVEVLTWKKH